MKIEQYQEEILRTVNEDMFTSEQNKNDQLKNFCMGLSGEVGELVDQFKKHFYQGHSIDMKKIMNESGDILWYLLNILNAYHIDIREVLEMNIYKLLKRYPNGFNKEHSKNRDVIKEMEMEFFDEVEELEEELKELK